MVWVILGILLVAAVVWMLVAPLRIVIDTDSPNPLALVWKGFFTAQVTGLEDDPHIELRVLGFKRRIDPFRPKAATAKPARPKSRKKHWAAPRRLTLRKGLQLLLSFKIRRLEWNLDTGDFTLNAKLWPMFFLLSNQKHRLGINFMGHNRFYLVVENRLLRLLLAYWKA